MKGTGYILMPYGCAQKTVYLSRRTAYAAAIQLALDEEVYDEDLLSAIRDIKEWADEIIQPVTIK